MDLIIEFQSLTTSFALRLCSSESFFKKSVTSSTVLGSKGETTTVVSTGFGRGLVSLGGGMGFVFLGGGMGFVFLGAGIGFVFLGAGIGFTVATFPGGCTYSMITSRLIFPLRKPLQSLAHMARSLSSFPSRFK